MFNKFLSITFAVSCVCLSSFAQSLPAGVSPGEGSKVSEIEKEDKSDNEKIKEQIKKLEDQVQSMQKQIDALKKFANNPKKDKIQQETVSRTVKRSDILKGQIKSSIDKVEVADRTPKKRNLSFNVGDYSITPYGAVWLNAFSNSGSGGTPFIDAPFWVTPTKENNIGATARQSQFGLKITGGKLGNANVTGIVEADFWGGFPSTSVGEGQAILRIRLAKAKFDWETTSLTFGQDWMTTFSPNNPASLAPYIYTASGNLWFRLPQIKVEQKFGENFKLQGAILSPTTGDFPAEGVFPLRTNSGMLSRFPFLQSRISYSQENWLGSEKTGTIGFSGHYGRSRVEIGDSTTDTTDIDSVGFSLDWNFPLATERITLAGEAFSGRNLSGFFGGVFQGYNTDFAFRRNNTLIAGGVRGIGTRGGWAQLGLNLPAFDDRLTAYASIGIDDPRNEDLVTLSRADFRNRNLSYVLEFIYEVSPQFSIGSSFQRLETSYVVTGKQHLNHVDFAAKYSF